MSKLTVLCALLLVCPLRASQPVPTEPSPVVFPYAYTPEIEVPGYEKFCAEGLSLREASMWALSYLKKWQRKKYSAPAEEINYFKNQRQLQEFLHEEAAPAESKNVVRLGMVGDIMWIRTQWNRFMTQEVLDYLSRFDAVLGNLESPIARSMSVPHYQPDCRKYNSDPGLVRSFRNANGTNVLTALSTANNHSLDCGDQGAKETMEFLDEERILHSGMSRAKGDKRYVTFVRKGINFGFYAATWGLNDPTVLKTTTINLNWVPGIAPETDTAGDLSEITGVLQEMKADGCDFRVVSLHWGHEFEYFPTPPTIRLGRRVIAAGADVVLGSHPHVQQPAEICFVNGYEQRFRAKAAQLPALTAAGGCVLTTPDGRPRKGLILYSMGNFVSRMYATLDRVGLIDDIQVFKDASGVTDWRGLHGQFVFNKVPQLVKLFGENPRRLLLVDHPPYPVEELNKREYGPQHNQTPLDFLRQHLGVE